MQVNQYLLDDHWILDAGNDLDGAAAFTARFDINTEHALEPLCPSHGRMTISGCMVSRLIRDFDPFAVTSLCRLNGMQNRLFSANTPWKRCRLG
jgi:hypothetical protein